MRKYIVRIHIVVPVNILTNPKEGTVIRKSISKANVQFSKKSMKLKWNFWFKNMVG